MRGGPLKEKLLECKLAVKDMPVWRIDDSLDIRRQQHLFCDDAVTESRRYLVNRVVDIPQKRRALGLPRRTLQRVRRMATEQVHDMFAGRSQRGVHGRRHHGRDEGASRISAMACVLVRRLKVLDVRADVDIVWRLEAACGRVKGRKAWRRLGCDIDLEGRRECAEVANVLQEFSGQLRRIEQSIE